jgi:SAM-dependent methyltransferase
VEETPRRLTFGAHADAYERARPEWPAAAARWFVPDDAQLVVELGAGTGKLTRALAGLGVRVTAVEPDPRMLSVLRAGGLDGMPGSAEEIPFEAGEADVVVAGSSLHWFDLERALPEIQRVLRPGGRLAFGWNHRDIDDPVGARVQELISASRTGAAAGWRTREWDGAVTAGGLFGDVESAKFPHVHEFPRDAIADHLLSYSGVAALPAGERERLVAAAVEELGDRDPVRLPFVVDGYRARRL